MVALVQLSSNPDSSTYLNPLGLPRRIEVRFRLQSSTLVSSQVAILPSALETDQLAPINALLPRIKLTLIKQQTNQASKLAWPLRQPERSQITQVQFLLVADLTSPSDDANCSACLIVSSSMCVTTIFLIKVNHNSHYYIKYLIILWFFKPKRLNGFKHYSNSLISLLVSLSIAYTGFFDIKLGYHERVTHEPVVQIHKLPRAESMLLDPLHVVL